MVTGPQAASSIRDIVGENTTTVHGVTMSPVLLPHRVARAAAGGVGSTIIAPASSRALTAAAPQDTRQEEEDRAQQYPRVAGTPGVLLSVSPFQEAASIGK